jgi:linoleate 9S-lipoxygenase
LQGKRGNPAYLEGCISTITGGESAFKVTFEWDEEQKGIPGAFLIINNHRSEFYLKSLTLQDVPGHGRIHFVCNSWVYPADKYKYDRVFFSNKVIPKLAYIFLHLN